MAIDPKTFQAWISGDGPIPPQLDAELQLTVAAWLSGTETVNGKIRLSPALDGLAPVGEALAAVLEGLDRNDAASVALDQPRLIGLIQANMAKTRRHRPAAKGGLERASKKAGTHKRWAAAAWKIHDKHPAWSAWHIAGELSKRRWRNSAGTLRPFARKTIYERIRPELTDPSK